MRLRLFIHNNNVSCTAEEGGGGRNISRSMVSCLLFLCSMFFVLQDYVGGRKEYFTFNGNMFFVLCSMFHVLCSVELWWRSKEILYFTINGNMFLVPCSVFHVPCCSVPRSVPFLAVPFVFLSKPFWPFPVSFVVRLEPVQSFLIKYDRNKQNAMSFTGIRPVQYRSLPIFS